MAASPEDRYASCRALAEDVERWTADEPVDGLPRAAGAAGPAVGEAEPDGGHRGGRGAGGRGGRAVGGARSADARPTPS